MFLLYKIRLALNVAPEGLPWHLRRPGPRVALHNVMLNQIQHLFIKGMPGQARHDEGVRQNVKGLGRWSAPGLWSAGDTVYRFKRKFFHEHCSADFALPSGTLYY